MTLPESLEAALQAGDQAAVRDLLAGLSEDERADLLPLARRHVAEVARRGLDGLSRLRPMLFVAYGLLPATEIRKLGWRSNHIVHLERLEDVLRRRAPERLAPIVDHLLDDLGGRAWPPVRTLVREGVVPRPERPSYTLAMLAATRYSDLVEVLAADPELLEVEIWRLFEMEGGGEDSLAAHEKYTGDKWGDLFRDLAARDPATRRRLLDASLAALARDFGTFRAGWFSRFHESLAPSDDERAERSDAYLRLLRSRSGPTVSFAITAVSRISRTRRVPPEPLFERINPVLVDGTAATAKGGLELVARAGADTDHAHDAAVAAAAALAHASPDVQGLAIKVIGKLVREPSEAIAKAAAEHVGDVAASQRPALEALLTRLGPEHRDVRQSMPTTPPTTAERAPRMAAAASSPLDPSRALEPLSSIDALVDVAVSLVETGEPADDIERVLDAVGRFTSERTDGFRRLTGPLARRARTMLDRRGSTPFNGFDARADVAAVLLAWTTGEIVAPSAGHASVDPGAGAFLSARAREVAESAGRGTPFVSAAAPTHRGGWIDPVVLVERLTARSPTSRLDLVAALLRLGPERRDVGQRAAEGLDGEPGAVVRYALGADEPIGPTAALWVAAARVRSPGQDDERVERRHPRLGPDAGRAARVELVTRKPGSAVGEASSFGAISLSADPAPAGLVDVGLPTVLLLRDSSAFGWFGRSEPAMLRWTATIQPSYREAWAAIGSAALARNVDWWSAQWANRAYLEPFVDPVTTIESNARRLIGIALGAKESGERGLATDIVRLALADGRMSAEDLAEGLSAAAAIGCDRPNRWARSLGEAATTSDGGASEVCRAVMGMLPAIADRPMAKLVPLLRLLNELVAKTGEPLIPAAQPSLTRLASSGGQAGRLARSILS